MTIEEMKRRKQELGYTTEAISVLSGVPVGTLQKIFSGATKSPRRSTILSIEKILIPKNVDCPANEKPGTGSYKEHHLSTLGFVAEPSVSYADGKKNQGDFTLADYYAWPEEERVELIDGVIYDMAAPLTIHQMILMELAGQFRDFVNRQNGECVIFVAPFDVQLDKDDRTMVQPDISVICDRNKLNRRGCYGAPDLVVEILSSSTMKKDVLIKLKKYVEAGVREYWMVDPDGKKIVVYSDLPDNLMPRIYYFQDIVPVGIWKDACAINFEEIYRKICFLYEKQE